MFATRLPFLSTHHSAQKITELTDTLTSHRHAKLPVETAPAALACEPVSHAYRSSRALLLSKPTSGA